MAEVDDQDGHRDRRERGGARDHADEEELQGTGEGGEGEGRGEPPGESGLEDQEAEGVIQGYRAVIDPAARGRAFEVLVDLSLESQDAATVERFEETLARADEVLELRRLFGAPDYFVRVAVADLAAYETFMSTRVMAIPGIRNIVSHFTMKNVKQVP